MNRLALATSVPLTPSDRELIEPLRVRGFDAESVTWTDAVDWKTYDAVVIRSCWDYHLRFSEFVAWLEHLESIGVPVINPLALTRWNSSKRYLLELEAAGVRIPRTVLLSRGASKADVARGLAGLGTRRIVVKPAVSASAHQTSLVSDSCAPGEAGKILALSAEGDVLLQEFVAAVQTNGEWSIVFFGAEYSHAVLKHPGAGDFRVQAEHGGSGALTAPPPALVKSAAAIIDRLPGAPAFARIDGIVVDGAFTLMEAELIDAELFMHYATGSGGRFADAIVRSLTNRQADPSLRSG